MKGSRVNFTGQQQQNSRTKRFWADELITSFGSVACYDEPIPASWCIKQNLRSTHFLNFQSSSVSFLAQFIVTVPNIDDLFSTTMLSQLCQLQQELLPYVFFSFLLHENLYWRFLHFAFYARNSRWIFYSELSAFHLYSPFQTIWNFPNYLGCLLPNSRANCSFVSGDDVDNFRKVLSIVVVGIALFINTRFFPSI